MDIERPSNVPSANQIMTDNNFLFTASFHCNFMLPRVKMAANLSPSKLEKAHEAIIFLSSLASTSSTTPRASYEEVSGQGMPVRSSNKSGVVEAADKALDALRRMRAGMTADKRSENRKRLKKEVSSIFSKKPKLSASDKRRVVWRHKFVCLGYRDQDRIPSTDAEKEELYQAGLGERELEFESLDLNQAEYREKILEAFPRLRDGGGFQLLKGIANSRSMEVLSSAVHTSPGLLKQRVGVSRTYVRPVQRDLDLTPLADIPDVVSLFFCVE